jgi:hypothetical protein
MGLFQKISCKRGKHQRSRSSVVRDPVSGLLRSRCRECGVQMAKDPTTGQWAAVVIE